MEKKKLFDNDNLVEEREDDLRYMLDKLSQDLIRIQARLREQRGQPKNLNNNNHQGIALLRSKNEENETELNLSTNGDEDEDDSIANDTSEESSRSQQQFYQPPKDRQTYYPNIQSTHNDFLLSTQGFRILQKQEDSTLTGQKLSPLIWSVIGISLGVMVILIIYAIFSFTQSKQQRKSNKKFSDDKIGGKATTIL